MAVDKSNGAVYVGDHAGAIWRYAPTGGAPVTHANYAVTRLNTEGQPLPASRSTTPGTCSDRLVVDGPVKKYDGCEFAAVAARASPEPRSPAAATLATDPATDDLYVNERGRRSTCSTPRGSADRHIRPRETRRGSRGVAVNSHTTKTVFAPNGGNVVEFGFEAPPRADRQPGGRHASDRRKPTAIGDFQVTPDGRFAAFSSPLLADRLPERRPHGSSATTPTATNSPASPAADRRTMPPGDYALARTAWASPTTAGSSSPRASSSSCATRTRRQTHTSGRKGSRR